MLAILLHIINRTDMKCSCLITIENIQCDRHSRDVGPYNERDMPQEEYRLVEMVYAAFFINQDTYTLIHIVETRRVPVEREIINVYDVFKHVGPLTHICFAPGDAPYPTEAITAPLTPPHIQNVTIMSDHSLAALPFRHLAFNVATAI